MGLLLHLQVPTSESLLLLPYTSHQQHVTLVNLLIACKATLVKPCYT